MIGLAAVCGIGGLGGAGRPFLNWLRLRVVVVAVVVVVGTVELRCWGVVLSQRRSVLVLVQLLCFAAQHGAGVVVGWCSLSIAVT